MIRICPLAAGSAPAREVGYGGSEYTVNQKLFTCEEFFSCGRTVYYCEKNVMTDAGSTTNPNERFTS